MEKRKKDKKKRHEKREKKNIYGKTKEHAKRLAHTSHVPHIFNLTLCGFSKVSRLGVLQLILSQTKFANLAQIKGLMYRDSPVSAVFWSPVNRTIGKTALIGD